MSMANIMEYNNTNFLGYFANSKQFPQFFPGKTPSDFLYTARRNWFPCKRKPSLQLGSSFAAYFPFARFCLTFPAASTHYISLTIVWQRIKESPSHTTHIRSQNPSPKWVCLLWAGKEASWVHGFHGMQRP